MIHSNETELTIFKNRCILAEESKTREKLHKTKESIDTYNHNLEHYTTLFQQETDLVKKNTLENKIIECVGEVRTLHTYLNVLKYKLSIVKPTSTTSSSLGYLAQEAKKQLIEMGIY